MSPYDLLRGVHYTDEPEPNPDQLSLDDAATVTGRPVARTTDPGTSWAAARDAQLNATTNRGRVLRALRDALPGGLTDYELADLVGLQQNSAGKRRGELRDAGFVESTGETRPAPSGSKAIVWRATTIQPSGDVGEPAVTGPAPQNEDLV